MSVFINIIQKFYSFILKAVLFFQKTMRVNSGMSLSNTGIYLRYSRELSQKNKNILWWTFPFQKRQKFKKSQPQGKFIGSYQKECVCTSFDAFKPEFKWHKVNGYFVPSHSSRWLLIILSLSVYTCTCLRSLSWKILSVLLT